MNSSFMMQMCLTRLFGRLQCSEQAIEDTSLIEESQLLQSFIVSEGFDSFNLFLRHS